MIPLLVPPLTDLTVLVTRPAEQANSLREHIEALGGRAIMLPALTIKAREVTVAHQAYDLLIVLSANAVKHGAHVLKAQMAFANTNGVAPRVAAVGTATAAALKQHGFNIDIAPPVMNSEGLLGEAALQTSQRVLIVRGQGGRELLRETLLERGCTVDICEVYERVIAEPEPSQLESVLRELREVDIITATSVETLLALDTLLDAEARDLIRDVALLAGSARIAMHAKELGWRAECVVSSSPENNELLGTLVRWRTRARN